MSLGKKHTIMNGLGSAASWFAVLTIRLYQACIRPHLLGSCKFVPSCSEYGIEAINRYGFIRGGKLTIARVVRCRPFTMGGFDPVPKDLDGEGK